MNEKWIIITGLKGHKHIIRESEIKRIYEHQVELYAMLLSNK